MRAAHRNPFQGARLAATHKEETAPTGMAGVVMATAGTAGEFFCPLVLWKRGGK